MLNQVVLVGRLTDDLEVEIDESDREYSILSLSIQRNFKNSEGLYDTDYVKCVAFGNIALNTSEYCHKGDIVGVKGRVENTHDTCSDITSMQIVAEKVTFLSNKQDVN